MRHASHEWVMSHMNESCLTWMSHVPHDWVIPHTQELVMKAMDLNVYGVVAIIRLLKITGLSCRISSLLQGTFAKETYDFKEPTNRRHPIWNNMSHVLHEWIMSHMDQTCLTWMSHVPHDWVIPHTQELVMKAMDLNMYGVATISRLLQIIGLFLQNIVSFTGLFFKRDLSFYGAY